MSPHSPALPPDVPCAAPAAPAPRPPSAADLLGRALTARELDGQPLTAPGWLWHGYLGPGKITLLTSQWKSGKTTLVSLLLARMQQGGQLAGLSVAPGQAFVISEESPAHWQPRCRQLGIRDHLTLLCRPFATQPAMEQWLALLDAAAAWHDRQGCALVVFDSLAQFLPAHSENSAGALLECLTPLQRLATAGLSVLLVHHPHKGKTLAGQAARGSGALPSFVDIIIEMAYHRQPDDLDRRRRLVAFSRHEETPRHLLLELQADGSDYRVLESGMAAALGEGWQAVLGLLTTADHKLTRQDILDNWPADQDRPGPSTLWRWLDQAVKHGHVRQEGTGLARDPFRYWLPERQELMRPGGGTSDQVQGWNNRLMAEVFAKLEAGGGTEPVPAPPLATAAGPSAPAPVGAPPEPPPAAEPVASQPPQTPVVLPYPYSLMNAADVPEAVWEQARAAQRKS
jgi:hypothetical protein